MRGTIIAAILAAPILAGPAPRLASFDEVRALADSPKARILDARSRADYDRGHVPGTVWVDVKAAETLAARPGGLADRAAWESWIAPLGIGPESEVVVLDGARQLSAARIWWLLGYLGVERVGLVDGNVPLWIRQGRPITTDIPEIRPATFPVAFRPDRLATRPEVLAALKDGRTRIVDARSPAEYSGERKLSGRAGHIPSACPLEWSELVDPDGRFLDPAAIRSRLDALGIKPGEPVIAHCQGGGRASVDAFALDRLGHPTRNFYLGWSDWGNAADTPIVGGPEPGDRP